MPLKTLAIETWGEYAPPKTSVRIKRQSDRAYFDSTDSKFKPEAQVVNPWVQLNPSTSPLTPNNVEALIDIDPKQWTDGDYTIYFHDFSSSVKKVYCISEVTVFDGDPTTRRSPNVTEIAGRVLDCTVASHKMPGTVGAWMLEITNRIQAIQTKLGI